MKIILFMKMFWVKYLEVAKHRNLTTTGASGWGGSGSTFGGLALACCLFLALAHLSISFCIFLAFIAFVALILLDFPFSAGSDAEIVAS